MACEQNEDWVVNEPMQSFEENPEYAPLNTIPDWVSEKVTPKEYELWRTMSSRYEINYSFLKKDITNCTNSIIRLTNLMKIVSMSINFILCFSFLGESLYIISYV